MRRTHIYFSFSFALAISASLVAAEEAKQTKKPQQGISRDLQGMWTGNTLTPLERPPELGAKSHYAPEELEQIQRVSTERFWQSGHRAGDVGRDNDAYMNSDMKILPNGQTSLVVKPEDGRIPVKPEAEPLRDFNLNNFDSYERMSQWDRCITRTPVAMLPATYSNAYQIVQTPTHIVIVSEMVHDARVIPIVGGQSVNGPTAGAAHIDPRVRSWDGDSRAHWEGNTLVVDTTNFNDRGWIATAGNAGRIRGIPYSTDLHTIERFTRIDAHTLAYELTIDDPHYYRSAWTIAYPLQRDDNFRMFEYACHEGNDAVRSILRGARVQEQASSSAH